MTWLIAGPILGAALLLAWMWWHSCRVAADTERVEQESKKFVADAWVACLNQHQRAFTAMDPKYVGRELIVQVDDPALAEQRRLDEMEL